MEIQENLKDISQIIANNKNSINRIKNIIFKWKQLRKNNKLISNLDWSEQIIKYDNKTAQKLYNFREVLKKYIMQTCNLCEKDVCTVCDAVGSTKLTSDIDVSINTEINFSISIKRLIIILNDLKLIFKDDKFFHHNGRFKLKLVHNFFDINFYITNFELTKNNTKNIGNFDRYFISNCYNNGCKNSINQYYFALLTFISLEYKNNGDSKISNS